MNKVAFHEKGFCMEYLCLLREGIYVRWICAFHEKGFDMRSWWLLGEGLQHEVYTFHEKGFWYECLIFLKKRGDGKRYRCFVGCNIHNMYDTWKYKKYGG